MEKRAKSKVYKLAKQIQDEIEEAEEGKQTAKVFKLEDKAKLEHNEEKILGKRSKNSSIGIKTVDVTIVIDEERAARRLARTNNVVPVFEAKLIDMMEARANGTTAFANAAANINQFANVEHSMMHWCTVNYVTLEHLVMEAF